MYNTNYIVILVLSPGLPKGSPSLYRRSKPKLMVIGGVSDRFTRHKYVDDPKFVSRNVDIIPIDCIGESPKVPVQPMALPHPRFKATTLVTAGRSKPYIYIVGGSHRIRKNGSVDVDRTLFCMNPRKGKWKMKHDMFNGRCDAVAFEVEQGFVVAGGWNNTEGTLSAVEMYSVKQDQWERKSRLPYSLDLAAACSIRGVGYVFGGRRGDMDQLDEVCGDVLMYYPSVDHWQVIKSVIQPPRKSHSVCTDGDKIYITGGDDGEYLLSILDQYDPETCQCTRLTDLPLARVAVNSIFYNGCIYIPGGAGNTEGHPERVSTTNGLLKYSKLKNSWTMEDAKLPRPVDWGCCAIVSM